MKNSTLELIAALFAIAGMVALMVGICLIPTLMLMWAWNLVMHGMFNFPAVGFWQAFALGILLGALRSVVTLTVKKK